MTFISKRTAEIFILVLPSLVLVSYFIYVALGWNTLVSISDWEGLRPSYNIVGFRHYANLFHDPIFLRSLQNNVLLFLIFVPGSLLVGLLLAVLLDQNIRKEGVFRTIYLLPFALSFVVTAVFWGWMYSPGVGIINSLLRQIGLERLASGWITDPNIAMYCIILALIWQFSGYTMVIFLAGIRSIPQSQIRAAKIDGASNFKLYRYIIIPQLKAPALAAFVILMAWALKTFDFIYVLTRGGPGYSTYVLPIMMYEQSFGMTKFAYGAAIANVLLILALLITIPYLYLSRRRSK